MSKMRTDPTIIHGEVDILSRFVRFDFTIIIIFQDSPMVFAKVRDSIKSSSYQKIIHIGYFVNSANSGRTECVAIRPNNGKIFRGYFLIIAGQQLYSI
jgi:hypothetical protein